MKKRYLIIKGEFKKIETRSQFDKLADKCFEITDINIEHPDDCYIETYQDELTNEECERVVFDANAKAARLAANSLQEKLNAIRQHRIPLMNEADIQINILFDADNDISLASWKSYRQNLRDITNNYKNEDGSPKTITLDLVTNIETDISWPIKPE
jgi:hypothetical protein